MLMDEYYDVQAAAAFLEETAKKASLGESTHQPLSALSDGEDLSQKLRVIQQDQPLIWRLVDSNPTDGELEEKVFSIQGVIVSKELPPIVPLMSPSPCRYLFMRQGISLVGLETPTFMKALEVVPQIYHLFRKSLSINITPSDVVDTDSHNIFHAFNRFLTAKKYASNMQGVALHHGVDPQGCLAPFLLSGEYIHTEENYVPYFVARSNNQGVQEFFRTKPDIFSIGDIVEIQVSFVVTPLNQKAAKMRAVLRSIALLDQTFSQKAQNQRASLLGLNNPVVTCHKSSLKRKVGYHVKDEVDEQRKRLADLKLKDGE